ncbi:MAG: 2-hydroxychromene-2-carboxylate isomerase, partial [Pseudomonadales bacterium]
MTTVEFHFDFGSPNAYLAHLAIPQIEQRTGARFQYVPVLLGGVFKATNNVSPFISLQGIKNKFEYTQLETQRWLARYGIKEYKPNPHFPVNTLQIMRGAVYALHTECFDQYVAAVYEHMWCHSRKMDDIEVIASSLAESGLPADEILEGMQQAEIKQQLIQATSASVERGNFGSPTFFLGEEMFFGKDSLRDLEDAL